MYTLTPGGGVDAKLGGKCGLRVHGDYVFMRDSGANRNDLRVGAGVVIDPGKK